MGKSNSVRLKHMLFILRMIIIKRVNINIIHNNNSFDIDYLWQTYDLKSTWNEMNKVLSSFLMLMNLDKPKATTNSLKQLFAPQFFVDSLSILCQFFVPSERATSKWWPTESSVGPFYLNNLSLNWTP